MCINLQGKTCLATSMTKWESGSVDDDVFNQLALNVEALFWNKIDREIRSVFSP